MHAAVIIPIYRTSDISLICRCIISIHVYNIMYGSILSANLDWNAKLSIRRRDGRNTKQRENIQTIKRGHYIMDKPRAYNELNVKVKDRVEWKIMCNLRGIS